MTREEFIGLPAAVALSILWDASPGLQGKLENVLPPKPARSPKFDAIIYRKDGVQWASETDVEGLRFWRGRYLESAAKGGEYAAKDEKRAKALDFWIAWRLAEPTTCWTGERNNVVVTAAPPSGKPMVYSREAPTGGAPKPTAAPSFSDEGSGEYDDEYDDGGDRIPF
jgi:hypothetical protein